MGHQEPPRTTHQVLQTTIRQQGHQHEPPGATRSHRKPRGDTKTTRSHEKPPGPTMSQQGPRASMNHQRPSRTTRSHEDLPAGTMGHYQPSRANTKHQEPPGGTRHQLEPPGTTRNHQNPPTTVRNNQELPKLFHTRVANKCMWISMRAIFHLTSRINGGSENITSIHLIHLLQY